MASFGSTFCLSSSPSGAILIGIAFIVSVGIVPAVLAFFSLGRWTEFLVQWGRWPVLLVATAAAVTMVYRYGPSRQHAKLRWLTWGAALATLVWIGASAGFSYYLKTLPTTTRPTGHWALWWGSWSGPGFPSSSCLPARSLMLSWSIRPLGIPRPDRQNRWVKGGGHGRHPWESSGRALISSGVTRELSGIARPHTCPDDRERPLDTEAAKI